MFILRSFKSNEFVTAHCKRFAAAFFVSTHSKGFAGVDQRQSVAGVDVAESVTIVEVSRFRKALGELCTSCYLDGNRCQREVHRWRATGERKCAKRAFERDARHRGFRIKGPGAREVKLAAVASGSGVTAGAHPRVSVA